MHKYKTGIPQNAENRGTVRKIDIYVYGRQPHHKSCDTDALITKSLGYYSEKHGIGFDENAEVLRDSGGKPHFKNGSPQIGVTHTDKLVFIAFDRDNFGIDAEKDTRTVKRSAEIAKKYMTSSERAYIDNAADRNTAFLEIWVKKEAYVKYTGAGLRGISHADTDCTGLCFSRIQYKDYIIYICAEKSAENAEIHDFLRGD